MGEERGNRQEKLGRRSKVELEFRTEWSGVARDIIRHGRAYRLRD
jgi:hypothetical protein